MRPLLVATLLSLTLLSALAPTVGARHAGPCTHEYAEAIRTGGLDVIERTVEDCVDRLLEPLCRLLDPCLP